MALFTRLSTIGNICKVRRTGLVTNTIYLRADFHAATSEPRIFRAVTSQVPFQKRDFFRFSIFKPATIQELKEKDDIPDEYQLIYRNTMARYISAAHIFTTLCGGLVCLMIALSSDLSTADLNLDFKETPGKIDNEIYVYLTVFIGICVVMNSLISKMPIRIYNLPKQREYVFIVYGGVPFTRKRVSCRIKELIKLEETGILPWKDSRYEIRDKCRLIMMETYFRTPADLNILLGYQKDGQDDK